MNDAAILRNILVARPDSGLLQRREFVLSRHGGATETYSLDLRDHAVLPALVNAHDHLQLNGLPPLSVQTPYSNSYAWAAAFQPYFEDAAVKQALAVPGEVRHWHGALKNALCGATTVMHHDPAQPVFEDPAFPAEVLRPYGWAHSLQSQYGPPVAHSFQGTPSDVGWFIHLAEGTDQVAASELQQLRALDCLHANTVLIHGVALEDEDIDLLIAHGASLVWCPVSNLTILGQTVQAQRLRRLFAAGRLALGSDSRLSGARDLLDELRVASQYCDLSPRELVQVVTVHARRLLRAAPARDDVIIFRRDSADPFHDLLQLRRHQLRAVIRHGEPLIADPDFEEWFVRRGIPYQPIQLDGRPKLCARATISPNGMPDCDLEPGLTLES